MNPTRGAESHPKRPVPKVEKWVIVVVEDHNGAPGRTQILPQGNESWMKYVHLADAAFLASGYGLSTQRGARYTLSPS